MGGVDVCTHFPLTSALVEGELSALRTDTLPRGKKPPLPIN
jgi:hypothetical protein